MPWRVIRPGLVAYVSVIKRAYADYQQAFMKEACILIQTYDQNLKEIPRYTAHVCLDNVRLLPSVKWMYDLRNL